MTKESVVFEGLSDGQRTAAVSFDGKRFALEGNGGLPMERFRLWNKGRLLLDLPLLGDLEWSDFKQDRLAVIEDGTTATFKGYFRTFAKADLKNQVKNLVSRAFFQISLSCAGEDPEIEFSKLVLDDFDLEDGQLLPTLDAFNGARFLRFAKENCLAPPIAGFLQLSTLASYPSVFEQRAEIVRSKARPRPDGAPPAGPKRNPSPEFVLEVCSELPLDQSRPLRLAPFDPPLPETGWLDHEDDGGDRYPLVRISQTQVIERPGGAEWEISFEVPAVAALDIWNGHVAEPVFEAVRTVRAAEPLSFLPKLSLSLPEGRDRYALVSFLATEKTASEVLDEKSFGFLEHSGAVVVLAPPSLSFPEPLPLPVDASFPCAIGEDSRPLTLHLDLRSVADGRFVAWEALPRLPGTGSAGTQVLRAGAFRLALPLPGGVLAAPQPGHLSAEIEIQSTDGAWTARAITRNLDLDIPLLSVLPGGQDGVPGDSGDRPEFDDVPDSNPRWKQTPYVFVPGSEKARMEGLSLQVNESIGATFNQEVVLRILGNRPRNSGRMRALVLDPAPFLVALVEMDADDTNILFGTTSEIANWSNRSGSSWEVLTSAPFALVLPPQAAGEAMHRRRSQTPDVEPGKPVAYRFSPPARFRLGATDFRQRYGEPPWNSRRILGYPGQRNPGAPLTEARFEVLYGVEGELHPRSRRLAEISSLLGALPANEVRALRWALGEERDLLLEAARRWKGLSNAIGSRLALFEIWDPGALDDRAGAPIRHTGLAFSEADGLVFRLRETAGFRRPEPVPQGFPGGEGDLAGSFPWAIESKNVLAALFRNRTSTSAELRSPLFSSLGAWGSMKASYDEGRSTIRASFAMGRVETLTVERLGRIGVFWNQAIHVTVYSRALKPAPMFESEQESFVGWPVLRKTDEYVEIPGEEKLFGDSVSDRLSAGPVAGCLFPHPKGQPARIRVNGSWGRDIGKTGWKIPLWKPGHEPSSAFPKPDVRLLLAGAPPGSVAPRVFDPEKLYFYTETTEGTGSDTDAWAPVPGLDFAFAEWNSPAANPSKDPDSFGPSSAPPAIEDGLSAHTFVLDASPARADVVHGRHEKPVVARLSNVTVMRGSPAPGGEDLWNRVQLADLHAPLDRLVHACREELRKPGTAKKEIEDLIESGLDALVAKAKDFLLDAKLPLDPGKSPVVVKDPCTLLAETIQAKFQNLGVSSPFVPEKCLPLRQAIEGVEAMFGESLAVVNALESFSKDGVKQRLEEVLSPVVRRSGSLDGFVRDGAKKLTRGLHERVREAREESLEALASAFVFLESIEELEDGDWEDLGGLLDGFRVSTGQELQEGLEALSGMVLGSLPGAGSGFRRLALRELARQSQKLSGILKSRDLPVVRECLSSLLRELSRFLSLADELVSRVEEVSGRLPGSSSPLDGLLEDLCGEIDKLHDDLGLDDAKKELREIIQEASVRIPRELTGHFESIASSLSEWPVAYACRLVPGKAELADILDRSRQYMLEAIRELTLEALASEFDRLRLGLVPDMNAIMDFIDTPDLGKWVGGSALTALRACGEAPRLPDLTFSLPELEYRFWDRGLMPKVDVTPVVLKTKEFLDGLNPLGMRLPVLSIADRFVPPDLGSFDLAGVFRKFAGLDQSAFFKGLKLPPAASDRIRVTHGIDSVSRSGWIQAEIDLPYDTDLPAFDAGAVRLVLRKPRYRAEARMEVEAGKEGRSTLIASLFASWDLSVGGLTAVTLEDCTLRFTDSGKFDFDVSPTKIRPRGELAFLSKLLSQTGLSESMPPVTIDEKGVTAALDLPLPDVQAGTFGISNLHLTYLLSLRFGEPGFTLATALSLGRAEAPFTLTLFVLGGAGHVHLDLAYTPSTGLVRTRVDVELFASASLGIALGPIRGSVSAYFGITAHYESDGQSAGRLQVGVKLLFTGHVSVLGIVSATLCLALEARYDASTGKLIGTGFVSYSIKIGWFLKIEVRSHVSYEFGAASRNGPGAAAAGFLPGDPEVFDYEKAAEAFHAQFEED